MNAAGEGGGTPSPGENASCSRNSPPPRATRCHCRRARTETGAARSTTLPRRAKSHDLRGRRRLAVVNLRPGEGEARELQAPEELGVLDGGAQVRVVLGAAGEKGQEPLLLQPRAPRQAEARDLGHRLGL